MVSFPIHKPEKISVSQNSFTFIIHAFASNFLDDDDDGKSAALLIHWSIISFAPNSHEIWSPFNANRTISLSFQFTDEDDDDDDLGGELIEAKNSRESNNLRVYWKISTFLTSCLNWFERRNECQSFLSWKPTRIKLAHTTSADPLWTRSRTLRIQVQDTMLIVDFLLHFLRLSRGASHPIDLS